MGLNFDPIVDRAGLVLAKNTISVMGLAGLFLVRVEPGHSAPGFLGPTRLGVWLGIGGGIPGHGQPGLRPDPKFSGLGRKIRPDACDRLGLGFVFWPFR